MACTVAAIASGARDPMFRRERPQRGRLRQFHQFDVEAIGFAGPDIDAELIALSARVFDRLGVDGITLELNSLGGSRCRAAYRGPPEGILRGSHAVSGRGQPRPAGPESAAHTRQPQPGDGRI